MGIAEDATAENANVPALTAVARAILANIVLVLSSSPFPQTIGLAG
jgi:hypothetical protein